MIYNQVGACTDWLFHRWALNNPHLSLHISHEERLTVATQRKRNGMPKRPRHSMASILSNLHLLLRVPSFARWPLKLHFFDREVHDKWGKYSSNKDVEPLPKTLEVATDFEPVCGQATTGSTQTDFLQDDSSVSEDEASEKDDEVAVKPVGPKWGIHALPLDHLPLTPYLEKGQDIITFEREGTCVVCHEHLDHGKGLYAICSHGSCEGVGHLNCWSRHILHQQGENQDSAVILPMQGRCPNCDGVVRWGDMMRELTLRTRGQKEVDKLLKRSRKAAGTKKTKTKSPAKGKGKAKDAATSADV